VFYYRLLSNADTRRARGELYARPFWSWDEWMAP